MVVRNIYTFIGQNHDLLLSAICIQISDVGDLKQHILDLIARRPGAHVWTPVDFLDLGRRDAVDKALQRLAQAGHLRRIDRGLYDTPRTNPLTKKPAVPDYRQIIDAVARRDQVRMLVDGLTAANDLGLTTAVPSHVVIHTDARRRSIQLDKLKIDFKHTAPASCTGPDVRRCVSYRRCIGSRTRCRRIAIVSSPDSPTSWTMRSMGRQFAMICAKGSPPSPLGCRQ